ncbi:MAG: protein kinase, partial [Gemmataceae bacterium]
MTPTDPTRTSPPDATHDPSDAALDAGLAAAFGSPVTHSYQSTEPESGTVIAGRYKLTEQIGEGGMGSVWVAHQTEPVKRKVAVKLIKAGMDSKAVLARFEAERQALAVMDHPNISKVLDGGLHDGRPYFVMELVKGVPITQFCDERKLTPAQRLELFVPVCQAIQHAHQKGIIHRDIKPSNVLVALYDDKPVPKVIDFGIAKATGGALTDKTFETAFGGVVGTPQYMSPEQASLNNLDVDTRSDVYSLGVLLYELLTGSPPFARKELEKRGLLELLRVVREEEPPRPSVKLSTADALPTLSANRGTEPKRLTGLLRNELDWIVMKALEKDRGRRYETANGFAADVLRYLSGEAVLAHPPSTAYRVKKFVRRHKGQVIAVSLVLLALLAGIAGTTLGLLEARRQEAEANKQAELARDEATEKDRQRGIAEASERKAVAAKEVEAQQRTLAEAEKKKAIEFRNKALDALRATTGADVEKLLGAKKQLTTNEQEYLEAIAKRWQAFAREEGSDEQSRAIRAEGHYRVARLWLKLSRPEDARAQYERAVLLLEPLSTEFPANAYYREELAACHTDLGLALTGLGKVDRAEVQYRKGLTLREKLVADWPTNPAYRINLAVSHGNLGNLFRYLGKWDDAERQFRKAIAVQEQIDSDRSTNTDPNYRTNRLELAQGYGNLGNLLSDMGKRPEAVKQYRKGETLLVQLVTDFPAEPRYRFALAGIHNNLGSEFSDMLQLRASREQYRKAQILLEQLSIDFPAVPDHHEQLASVCNNLGNLMADLGEFEESERLLRKGLSIWERLVTDFRTVPEYRDQLARTHLNLGVTLDKMGKRSEAEREVSEGLTVREKLVADFPKVLPYRVQLGLAYNNQGHLIRQGGNPAGSLEWFNKAIAILHSVWKAEPRDATARQLLMMSQMGRAEAYDSLKKFADADKDWVSALELSEKYQQPANRLRRAVSKVNAGQVTEAVAEAAELRKLSVWNGRHYYDLACVYSIASGKIAEEKQNYADRAMEMLQRSVKVGWQDAAHMKTDTDLDPLRDRED